MKIIIPKAKRTNKVLAYAEVKGSNGDTYTVVKRRKYLIGRTYSCTCPDFIFRDHPCKHIKAFRRAEKK